MASSRRFGFDTEFVGEDTYRPKLCLIQVATPERLILIDPFTAGPLDAFWALIHDPANQVVAHAAREEIRLCHAFTGKRPERVFDLQVAAGLVGLNYPIGHGNLVYHVLGVSLSKTETLTEWRDRPLTERQIRYALDDVRFLLRLETEISRRIAELGRADWAEEELARVAALATEDEPAQERWRKLRGTGSMSRRQLAVVRALFEWREEEAARLNRPARIVCRDDLLIEITRRNPQRERDLQVVRGLAKRHLSGIVEAVQRAHATPPDGLPTLQEREEDPPQVALLTSLLSAVLGHLCAEKRLAGGLVCATRDLRALVRATLGQGEGPTESILDTGWRREHIRPQLEAVLRGERSVRVARGTTRDAL